MATIKLTKDVCHAVNHFKVVRKQSDELQRNIHDLHESILDDQEQHTAKLQAQHSDENPDDPNDHSTQFRIHESEQAKLKKLYRDAIKNADNEKKYVCVCVCVCVFYHRN